MIIKKGKKIIAKDAILISSFIRQMIGLRFSKQKNLIFDFKKEKKEVIDMFFVCYPIDLIFLDKDKKVIELKRNFRPFEFYKNKKPARYMIELKNNSIKEKSIVIGDKIEF
jgi:uncharacterized membrane protein (UPF0127 family)